MPFDPYRQDVRRDPYPHYRRLLAEAPVQRGAHNLWYVARHADVQRVMADAQLVRRGFRDAKLELFGRGPLSRITSDTLFFLDPPDHSRLRDLIQPAFSPVAVDALQEFVARTTEELLAPALSRGTLDVVADLARPLPVRVISRLLGIPRDDADRVVRWSCSLSETADPIVSASAIERGHHAVADFIEYIQPLLHDRRRHPTSDLLSTLATAVPHRISEDEAMTMVIVLVSAGHETTTALIGNGMLALLRHRDERQLLVRNPQLIASAVEECLRYDAPVQQNARIVSAGAIRLGGHDLREGEMVIALQGAANRDPAQFPNPDAFRIERTPNKHISFGRGMHFCLGAPLARLQARVALGALSVRLVEPELAVPEGALQYAPTSLFRALKALPLCFEPRRSEHPRGRGGHPDGPDG